MDNGLFNPPRWLPLYLLPFWPLIWWRIQRVRAWFRAAGGPGAQMLWGVDKWGRVVVMAVSDNMSARGAVAIDPFAFEPSRAYAAALNGDQSLLPGEKGVGMRGLNFAAGISLAARTFTLTPAPLPWERGLSLPEP